MTEQQSLQSQQVLYDLVREVRQEMREIRIEMQKSAVAQQQTSSAMAELKGDISTIKSELQTTTAEQREQRGIIALMRRDIYGDKDTDMPGIVDRLTAVETRTETHDKTLIRWGIFAGIGSAVITSIILFLANIAQTGILKAIFP